MKRWGFLNRDNYSSDGIFHLNEYINNPTVNVTHMALRRRSGPAGGKARNEDIGVSQSTRGKDVSRRRICISIVSSLTCRFFVPSDVTQDLAIEDIESPAPVEETTEGVGSYQKEAGLRASSRSSISASSSGGTTAKEASPRGA